MPVGTCNHGVTDGGKSIIGSIIDAAAVAAAVINTKAAIEAYDKQYDIAKRQLNISEWWNRYHKNTYRPVEDMELAEVMAMPITQPEYNITIGRHRNFALLQFKGLAEKSAQCTSEYCTGLRGALIKDVQVGQATALSALSNMGYRNERAYVEARNDVRFNRKLVVANRGRGYAGGNVQFAGLASGIFGDLGRQAGAAAGGAMRYLGYSWNRNETVYPTLERGNPATYSYPTPRVETPLSYIPYQTPSPVSGYVPDGTGGVRPATDAELGV